MFSNVIGDNADNRSEWDSLLVNVEKSIDARCCLSRVKSVVERALNDFVLLRF